MSLNFIKDFNVERKSEILKMDIESPCCISTSVLKPCRKSGILKMDI